MSAPYLHLGLWQAGGTSAELASRARDALLAGGGRARKDGRLAIGDLTASVERYDATEGALAGVTVGAGEIDDAPDEVWQALVARLAEVVLAVRPTLATLAVEDPPDLLPDPPEIASQTLFSAGWVDLGALQAAGRAEFEKLADRGRAERLGPGVWWGSDPGLWPHPSPAASRGVSVAAYRAWAAVRGTAADPGLAAWEEPGAWQPAEPPAARGELWFWSATDEEGLAARAADALGENLDSWLDPGGEPGLRAVVAAPRPPTPAAGLLAILVELLGAVGEELAADWAAVQPESGVAVPGLDPDLPQTGVLRHPWVSAAWLGGLLPELAVVLDGCARLDVAGGTLWVTDPSLELPPAPEGSAWVPFADPAWSDPDVAWSRLGAAAALLSSAVRRAAPDSPGELRL